MKRRGFFGAIIAAAAAPAIVRAESLMPITAPKIIMPSMEIITPNQVFGEVFYTGDGMNVKTINHSLGYAPQFILVKAKGSAGGWQMHPIGGAS